MDADEESPPPPPPPVGPPQIQPRKPSASPSPVQFPIKSEEEPAMVPPVPAPKPLLQIQPTKKKIDVKDVFNQDDDDGLGVGKKKKLAPLPTSGRDHGASGGKGNDQSATGNSNDSKKSGKSNDEDKRKHIKSLIDKIPTDKSALFEYSIDWDLVDNQLMEKRIRPWVNKKIAEYIGEPEPSLTDFICSKVLAGSNPKAILEDVQMVLDEEAEVFVVKMWRLLIYEIENKKQKSQGVVSNE